MWGLLWISVGSVQGGVGSWPLLNLISHFKVRLSPSFIYIKLEGHGNRSINSESCINARLRCNQAQRSLEVNVTWSFTGSFVCRGDKRWPPEWNANWHCKAASKAASWLLQQSRAGGLDLTRHSRIVHCSQWTFLASLPHLQIMPIVQFKIGSLVRLIPGSISAELSYISKLSCFQSLNY